MRDSPQPIAPREAWRRLERGLAPLAAERIARRRAADRVLAHDLDATVDAPAHDVSAMDGYAVCGAVAAGDRRPVVGLVAAGDAPGLDLPSDAAVRIMTGAPVPGGADHVVPIELTDGGVDEVLFRQAADPGGHIRRRGEILRAGERLLAAGTLLTPGALSLLASHGHSLLPVHRQPRVAFLTTGDEVVPPELVPRPGQLRDSHSDFLLAAGHGLGLELTPLGIAPDRPEVLRERALLGLESDVFLICGGVSKGDYDLVEGILEELGCEILFDAVAIQPGKPLVAARHANGWVVGLPGNPASVMVAFWLFVRPLLRRLMGIDDAYWRGAQGGVLAAPLPGAKGRDRFLPAEIESVAGELRVWPFDPKGSHDQAAYARGTALVRVPAHAEPAEPGAGCEILRIAGSR